MCKWACIMIVFIFFKFPAHQPYTISGFSFTTFQLLYFSLPQVLESVTKELEKEKSAWLLSTSRVESSHAKEKFGINPTKNSSHYTADNKTWHNDKSGQVRTVQCVRSRLLMCFRVPVTPSKWKHSVVGDDWAWVNFSFSLRAAPHVSLWHFFTKWNSETINLYFAPLLLWKANTKNYW